MNSAKECIEQFCANSDAGGDKVRGFQRAISECPVSEVIEEYVRFYNKSGRQVWNWHFWWIFSGFPLPNQLELIEKAVDTAAEDRTAFDNRILSERRLIELLSFPKNSEHKSLFQMLKYGWDYYMYICKPSAESVANYLSGLVGDIRSLIGQPRSGRMDGYKFSVDVFLSKPHDRGAEATRLMVAVGNAIESVLGRADSGIVIINSPSPESALQELQRKEEEQI